MFYPYAPRDVLLGGAYDSGADLKSRLGFDADNFLSSFLWLKVGIIWL